MTESEKPEVRKAETDNKVDELFDTINKEYEVQLEVKEIILWKPKTYRKSPPDAESEKKKIV